MNKFKLLNNPSFSRKMDDDTDPSKPSYRRRPVSSWIIEVDHKNNSKRMLLSILILTLCVLMLTSFNASAEDLGRLFTTPAQRAMLEKLRYSTTEPVVYRPVEVVEPVEDTVEIIEEIPVLEEPLNLKGVVYRNTGSNTAWINESNTFEGGFENEMITVKTRDIKKDSVKVKLPDNVTNITLRVGETYQPEYVVPTGELEE